MKFSKMISSLRVMLAAGLLMLTTSAFAQNITVKGVVKDAEGLPLIGASVFVPGTSTGAITDADGAFSFSAKTGAVITVSFLGYEDFQFTASEKPQEIRLVDSSTLEEVVVTALGVAREKKSLGYAIQDVKGDALLQTRETNIANALTGKIAGVDIIRSSNGPAGSTKIVLRGNNSLTGLNQPLIVVDGIPMDNFTGTGNAADYWNRAADMGNGLSDINPEDVESMTVLKGGSAAALYGSRAGNGVILITTKKGHETPGLGLTINGTVAATTEFTRPSMQKLYGQGDLGEFNADSYNSWGPEITGQQVTNWDGKSEKLSAYDNVNKFFGTGITNTENITFSQQYGRTGIYASWTRTEDVGQVSTMNLKRNNFMLRGTSTFGKNDKWHFDAKVQYIKAQANNRPLSGSNVNANYMLKMYVTPVSVNIADFAENYGTRDGKMYYFGPKDKTGTNPYWMSHFKTNQDIRNRFLMNASLRYDFTEWLDLEAKAGSDMYFTEEESRYYAGNYTDGSKTGSMSLGEKRFFENNFSFLLKAHKDNLWGDFGGNVTLGGNLMERENRGISSSQGQFRVPDVFDLNNGASKPNISESYSHRKMNSLYGSLQLNYGGWLYLDATFRNDWTSTLSKENRSFFYPSVSLSYVISDMVNKYGRMPEWFSYAKVRASYAEVGNDMDPYQLYNVYTMGTDPNGNSTLNSGSTLYDETVKNELIKTWEAGFDVRFFDNRLGLDFAWYKSNAVNQLINLPISAVSYSSKKINAGNIQNKGFEVMLTTTPVQTKNFIWNSNINFSTNENTIIELADGITEYNLGGFDKLNIVAYAGGGYGDIWGTKYKRVEDENSPYYGQKILTSEGLPQSDGKSYYLGNQNSKCNVGWNNTFQWRDLSFGFQFDGRFGGKMYSGTLQCMENTGTGAWTVEGREGMVVEGVIEKDGQYVQNTQTVTGEKYWKAISNATGSNLGICEENLYDATNVRLRNVNIAYSLPKQLLKKGNFFQSVKFGFTVNNVWMIYSCMRGLDPESIFDTSTNATGFEYGANPTTRSYVFNVSFGF